MQYHVAWRSKETGHIGHGVLLYSKDQCQRICDQANKAFPECEHWPEEDK